jgi:hypothetical protein
MWWGARSHGYQDGSGEGQRSSAALELCECAPQEGDHAHTAPGMEVERESGAALVPGLHFDTAVGGEGQRSSAGPELRECAPRGGVHAHTAAGVDLERDSAAALVPTDVNVRPVEGYTLTQLPDWKWGETAQQRRSRAMRECAPWRGARSHGCRNGSGEGQRSSSGHELCEYAPRGGVRAHTATRMEVGRDSAAAPLPSCESLDPMAGCYLIQLSEERDSAAAPVTSCVSGHPKEGSTLTRLPEWKWRGTAQQLRSRAVRVCAPRRGARSHGSRSGSGEGERSSSGPGVAL